ncbi:ABC transporter ATP-binding protein [Thermomonas sp. HDW16]|uniref:ABC transporter ATP-binding protein n=1 Tax=Thermomonas sp. HDW16 TaxID=2714945 RepID=UPI00140B81DA|nr:ABC transporter ATP-binding protein [Thermomonas sp. HDW16]QIL20534.1 ABC transporter ATP-binding protein [Thermomonas sp. HDW16]
MRSLRSCFHAMLRGLQTRRGRMFGKEEAGRADGFPLLMALLRPRLPVLLVSLALMLVQSIATLAQPWLGGVLTDRLLLGAGVGPLLWVLFGLILAQQALGYLVSIQLQAVSGRLVSDAGSHVYEHLQSLPMSWHHERQRGDVLALLTGDVYRLGNYVTGTLVPLVPLLFTFVGALVMMLRVAPAIAIAVGVLMPVLFILLKLVGRRLRPLSHLAMQAWADQAAMAEQNLSMLAVIKAFATAPTEASRYSARVEDVREIDLRRSRLEGAIAPVVHVLGAGAILLLLGTAGHFVAREEMRMGELVSLLLYGLVLVSPVSQLARVYGSTQAARGTAQRMLTALQAVPEADEGARDFDGVRGEVTFERVDFRYPGRPVLLQGFDLRIAAGETVALTGSNGAGKSTLMHLLLRLVEPGSGCIRIDGIHLRDYRLPALREGVGLVAQQVMLFNATVAENIAYGHAGAAREQIEAAARAARAHDFVTVLPLGYDTVVGDQGVKLSGGQKQRIALARALLKNPPILILDEATAMFDPEGEAEFIAECHDVIKQRTVILITHRPASLALADRVLRLEQGRLVAAVTLEGGT